MLKSDNNLLWSSIIIFIILIFIINLFIAHNIYNYEQFINWGSTGFSSGFSTESSSSGSLLCAKNCCFSGWPASIQIDESNYGIKQEDMGIKYRATNLKCNNGFTGGCVCEII